ncbi:MAG: hypothetical protein JWP31_738 [Aeromicrobium sp.]|nr:hypothetical protein [Aeromicrobium sp.]
MTTSGDLLVEAFSRIRDGVTSVVDGLTDDQLTWRPAAGANSIAWLVWHLLRVQDDHVAHVAGVEQVWTRDGWSGLFGLPFDDDVTGYGQTPDEVASVRISAEHLAGYAQATAEQSLTYVRSLAEDDLTQVVDDSWEPPVTLAVRLASVIDDDLKHLGQAEYVRGLL